MVIGAKEETIRKLSLDPKTSFFFPREQLHDVQ